jgi:tRNA nucleotidyltransferase (CCA-adding enzyme)
VDKESREDLRLYLENWKHVEPKTTGHDLKERGLPPGPEYQNILRQLRNAWLDGKVKSEQEESDLLETLAE